MLNGFFLICLLYLSLAAPLLAAPALKPQARLTREEASARAQAIEELSYRLDLDITDPQELRGEVTIDFRLKKLGQPLRVDFAGGEVLSVAAAGQEIPFLYDGVALSIAAAELKEGKVNSLRIRFKHPYSKDGNGLYRFDDPSDGEAYLYTHFEPYSANRMFPCFDQPDLKASFALEVLAPKDWTVVSAMRESRIEMEGEKGHRLWSFPPSARFSTYLISLHAGPYEIWEDKSFRYPLRLMARKSMASHMPREEWLEMTRFGFDYFEEYFGFPYPFQKYDQVAVPDFNAGAMENVAAVTFSERFLVRGHRSRQQQEGLANTILHEMAHMWFGNLVTMRWWDDLWLNESFATYASTLALAKHQNYPETWFGFSRSKRGAYAADQLVTTHPIAGAVPHTEAAMSNFDAITYGKGASFLKLLHFVVGEQAFRLGLQNYFRQHAFQNTVLDDLIKAMEKSAGRSLSAFSESWLQSAGVNRLSVEVQCDTEKQQLEQLNLVQTAPLDNPTLREHKLLVGLYRFDAKSGLNKLTQAAISYQGARTVWRPAAATVCPDMVFPNEDDHDYVRVELDPKTLALAREHLHAIDRPDLRLMIWHSLTTMAEEAEISLLDFASIVQNQWPKETHIQVLRTIDSAIDRHLLPLIASIPAAATRNKILAALQQPYEQTLLSQERELETKLLAFDSYLRLLEIEGRAEPLRRLLREKQAWPDFRLDQDQRWEVLGALSSLGDKGILQAIEKEKKQDPSSAGRRASLRALAAYPDFGRKMELLAPIVAKTSPLAAADRLAILSRLFPEQQAQLRKRYLPTYEKAVPEVVRSLEASVARSYVLNILPAACDREQLPYITRWLEAELSDSIRKGLLVARQSHERCLKIMDKLAEGSGKNI